MHFSLPAEAHFEALFLVFFPPLSDDSTRILRVQLPLRDRSSLLPLTMFQYAGNVWFYLSRVKVVCLVHGSLTVWLMEVKLCGTKMCLYKETQFK